MLECDPYNSLNGYLKKLFGCRVQKIPIDAGFTCPNRDGTKSTRGCIYCNSYGSGTGALRRGLSISEQIRRGKLFLKQRYGASKFIAYFQSFSNTYGPLDILRERYEEALEDNDIVGLAIGTRPDCVDEETLSLIAAYKKDHLVWIEYGLQSAHDRTLDRINRGHSVADFLHAVRITKDAGIDVCVHIILGLPGETGRDVLETANLLALLGIQGLKIHALYIVKGSEMEGQVQKGRYVPLTQEEYVELVCDVIELIPPAIIIHRLTGDARPAELVAPLWIKDKAATIKAIRATLKRRGSSQGSYLGRGITIQ